jgi:hypothetical protein
VIAHGYLGQLLTPAASAVQAWKRRRPNAFSGKMGIDALDFAFHIEKGFGLQKISRDDFDKLSTLVPKRKP